jgi:hypothetical protein
MGQRQMLWRRWSSVFEIGVLRCGESGATSVLAAVLVALCVRPSLGTALIMAGAGRAEHLRLEDQGC